MMQHNTPRYPYALEGDELGQRVYDSLRAPIESTIHDSPLSEASQTRLERAEAWLAARSMGSTTDLSMDIVRSQPGLERISIEDITLPELEDVADQIIELY